MYKIFLCEYIHPHAYAMLAERAEIISDPARLGECDGAINRNLRMDGAWLEGCPRLKVIGVHGTGLDGVDLEAAARRGIRVVNTPGENAASVAELIVGMALSLSRHMPRYDRDLQSGKPLISGGGSLPGRELAGRVFGTVGTGSIAQRAVKILTEGFGMAAIGWSPNLTDEKAARMGLRRCASMEEVFREADIVSLSVPLTDTTCGMVNEAVLEKMKPDAILINTARGGLVDEKALYQALVSGKLAGAASDVLCQEPPTLENPLVQLPNFLAMPHIGANTEEALYRVSTRTVRQILDVLDGLPVPGQAWA